MMELLRSQGFASWGCFVSFLLDRSVHPLVFWRILSLIWSYDTTMVPPAAKRLALRGLLGRSLGMGVWAPCTGAAELVEDAPEL